VYGDIAQPRGYLYGASGGAYQTLGGAESTSGVWDGFVPMVPGVPNAIPNFQAAQVLALRVLHGKLAQIDDAVEPGGSGDPYAGLSAEQQDTLLEVTRLGMPLRGWWQWQALNGGSFSAVAGGVRAIDPTYVNDFWTVPGYEGANPASPVQAARIQYDTTVASLVGAPVTGVVVAGVPSGDLTGADLIITSGAAAGKTVTIESASGTTVGFPSADPTIRSTLQPGDHVRIDNSWLLALQYYPRYQVPAPDQYAWNQYRNANGTPRFPQRPMLAGPFFAKVSGEATPLTPFTGKMIMLASTMDVQALAWSADWYRSQVQKMFGAQVNGHYRLWFMDNADHDPNGPAVTTAPHAAAHIVSYVGEFQQALLDLDAWVAHGRAPAPTSTYTVDANTQVHVPTASDQRGGLQPIVTLSARSCALGQCVTSDSRIDVKAGQPVRFSIAARTQLGTSSIVRTEWDFNGLGTYPVQSPLAQPRGVVFQGMTYTFMKPGTYFPVVRVSAQRDPHGRYGVIQNLARVRVVVH
jgi:hypothetical protein